MSIFFLKLIAMAAMLLDHVTEVFGPEGWNILRISNTYMYMRGIGRISFPIFAFGLTEGWKHTHSKSSYFNRLSLAAAVSEIPFVMAFYIPNLQKTNSNSFVFRFIPAYLICAAAITFIYWFIVKKRKYDISIVILALTAIIPSFMLKAFQIWLIVPDELNVLYTLLLGSAVMYFTDMVFQNGYKIFEKIIIGAVVAVSVWAYGLNADYGTYFAGLILILTLYIVRRLDVLKDKCRYVQGGIVILWGVIYYGVIFQNPVSAAFTVIPGILIMLYNESTGSASVSFKRLFYIFYPAHLLIIGIVNVCLKYV